LLGRVPSSVEIMTVIVDRIGCELDVFNLDVLNVDGCS